MYSAAASRFAWSHWIPLCPCLLHQADRFTLEAIESLVSNPACQHTLILLSSRLQGDQREAQLTAMLERMKDAQGATVQGPNSSPGTTIGGNGVGTSSGNESVVSLLLEPLQLDAINQLVSVSRILQQTDDILCACYPYYADQQSLACLHSVLRPLLLGLPLLFAVQVTLACLVPPRADWRQPALRFSDHAGSSSRWPFALHIRGDRW